MPRQPCFTGFWVAIYPRQDFPAIVPLWCHFEYCLGQLGAERNRTAHDADTRDQTLEQLTSVLLCHPNGAYASALVMLSIEPKDMSLNLKHASSPLVHCDKIRLSGRCCFPPSFHMHHPHKRDVTWLRRPSGGLPEVNQLVKSRHSKQMRDCAGVARLFAVAIPSGVTRKRDISWAWTAAGKRGI